MNIINPAGLMNTDIQSAPVFDMLGRFSGGSGGQKNVENAERKSVAFYNKLFFPRWHSLNPRPIKFPSNLAEVTRSPPTKCPNVEQKET